jgi:peptide/nickel transport system permease protein
MLYFAARRVLLSVCVCATVLVVSSVFTRLLTDPAGPLSEQLLHWGLGALHGDLGRSLRDNAPVSGLIWAHVPLTLQLGLISIVMALAVAVPTGILAATYEGTFTDHGLGLLVLIGQAMPAFWLGLLLSIWFGLDLQWLPVSGADTWQGYVLPGIVLAISAIPALMRLTRSGMIDALSSDYARTARAKGVEQMVVVLKHALRNAAVPIMATTLVQLGKLLGGAIVIEVVFSLHGIGYLAWESISKHDFPVVQALVLLLASIYITLALLADVLKAWLDPDLRGASLSPAEFMA